MNTAHARCIQYCNTWKWETLVFSVRYVPGAVHAYYVFGVHASIFQIVSTQRRWPWRDEYVRMYISYCIYSECRRAERGNRLQTSTIKPCCGFYRNVRIFFHRLEINNWIEMGRRCLSISITYYLSFLQIEWYASNKRCMYLFITFLLKRCLLIIWASFLF